jgi:hypothetical protein
MPLDLRLTISFSVLAILIPITYPYEGKFDPRNILRIAILGYNERSGFKGLGYPTRPNYSQSPFLAGWI